METQIKNQNLKKIFWKLYLIYFILVCNVYSINGFLTFFKNCISHIILSILYIIVIKVMEWYSAMLISILLKCNKYLIIFFSFKCCIFSHTWNLSYNFIMRRELEYTTGSRISLMHKILWRYYKVLFFKRQINVQRKWI